MTLYTLALFVHLVGVIVGLAGVCGWLFALISMRAARTVDQVRALLALYAMAGNVGLAGIALIVVGGLYMALSTSLGRSAWLIVATISFVVVLSAGGAILGPRLQALSKLASAAPEGPLPASLVTQIHDPFTRVVLQTYIAVLFGIVFLMTIKPSLVWAIVVILIATALGVLSGLPLMRTARTSTS
ncbi:MAG TPA: DUF2269 family protein [Ktedonobacterales bacterium]|nr:DUF2269 family protein [Ktedonobacterales bacterium]